MTQRERVVVETSGSSSKVEDAPHPTDVHVGRRLRFRRSMLGISQTQLAEKVGLTFQAIQKYERGENRISASRLHQFAEILGVSVADFFDGLPGAKAGAAAMHLPAAGDYLGLSEREAHEVLRAYSGIGPGPLRRSLLRVLRDSAATVAEINGRKRLPAAVAGAGDGAAGTAARSRPRRKR
jgi:transcriptional regulator with XRE-family HTH domain